MKAEAHKLLDLIKGPKQFEVPIYQRPYSWEKSHCDDLLEDILEIGSKEEGGHFIGSIVYFEPGIHTIAEVKRYLLIDGQQRLTSVSLLIAGMIEFLNKNDIPDSLTTTTKLENYYLYNHDEEGNDRYRLLLKEDDAKAFKDVLSQRAREREDFEESSILSNYKHLYDQITKDNFSTIYIGLHRLLVVDVALDKKDNPQLIFESLNSTGKELAEGDLIRNYVLMGLDPERQTRLYYDYWKKMEDSYGDQIDLLSSFFRYYLMYRGGENVKSDKVYTTFKQFLRKEQSNGVSIEDLIVDFYRYSRYYVKFALLKEKDPEIIKVFKELKKIRTDPVTPFIFALYNDYEEGVISTHEFVKICTMCRDFVMRRAFVSSTPSNEHSRIFISLSKAIDKKHKESKQSYLDAVSSLLITLSGLRRFPTDDEFSRELENKKIYNFNNVIRNYLFERLENFNRREPVNTSEFTIEHILPQNPRLSVYWQSCLGEDWRQIQEQFVHTLGNLTLTAYNSELSDKDFPTKKKAGFIDSPLFLNRWLQKQTKWDKESIIERGRILVQRSLQIWQYPQVNDQSILEHYETISQVSKEKRTGRTPSFYENLAPNTPLRDLYEKLEKRVKDLDPFIEVKYVKLNISFKFDTNFMQLTPNKDHFSIWLPNIKLQEIIDPKKICSPDQRARSRGTVKFQIRRESELVDAMYLIEQALDLQRNNGND